MKVNIAWFSSSSRLHLILPQNIQKRAQNERKHLSFFVNISSSFKTLNTNMHWDETLQNLKLMLDKESFWSNNNNINDN